MKFFYQYRWILIPTNKTWLAVGLQKRFLAFPPSHLIYKKITQTVHRLKRHPQPNILPMKKIDIATTLSSQIDEKVLQLDGKH